MCVSLGGGKMVTVKLLKPYYIKMSSEYIRIILAYQYFTLIINGKVYHFVPIKGKEIRINRKTKQVVNTETKFAFQKEKDIIYITVKKLTTLSDFMMQLDRIIKPYYEQPLLEDSETVKRKRETDKIIKELEFENLKRLIDKALDEKDQKAFEQLVKFL